MKKLTQQLSNFFAIGQLINLFTQHFRPKPLPAPQPIKKRVPKTAISYGFQQLTDNELTQFAARVFYKMRNNPDFVPQTKPLYLLSILSEAFQKSVVEKELTRNGFIHKQNREKLIRQLHFLASAVIEKANLTENQEEIICGAGFKVKGRKG